MNFFTICNLAYLNMALTWAESVSQTIKGAYIRIILVDEFDLMDTLYFKLLCMHIEKHTALLKMENFDITLDNSILESGMKRSMLDKYNIVEYCTAIKPFCFEYLFHAASKQNGDLLVYMDPDTYVYEDFTAVFEGNNNSIYLTPHILTRTYDTTSISDYREWKYLQVGIFNLGFLGLRNSQNSVDFIKWWQSRLIQHCVIDRKKGIFVDQKWCDFIPSLYNEFLIIKEKGFNIAYWNMYEREDLFKNYGNIYFIHYSVRKNLAKFDFMKHYLNEYNDKIDSWSLYLKSENPIVFTKFKSKKNHKESKLKVFFNKVSKKIGFAI